MSIQPLDSPVYQESYYADAPITRRLTAPLAAIERSPLTQIAAGALIAVACYLLGYFTRGAFAYDYHQLAWLVPLVTFLVAWGNARRED